MSHTITPQHLDESIRLRFGESDHEHDRFAFEFYARVARDIVGTETCSIFIYDPLTDKVWLKSSTSLKEREIEVPKQGSFVGRVVETCRHLIIRDASLLDGAHKTTDALLGFETRNLACVPVMSTEGHHAIGAIQAINKHGDEAFTPEDLRFLEDVSRMLRAQVERTYLKQKVFEAASLTGVSVLAN